MIAKNRKYIILLSAVICVLLLIDIHISVSNVGDNIYEQIKRFMDVFNIVRQYYVEDVDSQEVVTGAIQGMLEKLDPHSVYITAEQLKNIDEQFKGHYYGIGIEFVIKNKILTVISPIAGSP